MVDLSECQLQSLSSVRSGLQRTPKIFRFVEPIYDTQRRSFIKERLRLSKASKRKSEPRALPRVAHVGQHSFSNSRCLKANQIIENCQQVEQRPWAVRQIPREKALLKKYSARMDWTMHKVTEYSHLPSHVLNKLLEELAKEKFDEELALLQLWKKKRKRHAFLRH